MRGRKSGTETGIKLIERGRKRGKERYIKERQSTQFHQICTLIETQTYFHFFEKK